MKNSNMRWLIAAAALAVAAGSASAQTFKAEIPLAFRAGTTQMAPGAYQIDMLKSNTNVTLARVMNLDTNKAVLVVAPADYNTAIKSKSEGKAVIDFSCSEGRCSLARLWDGRGEFTYKFATPRKHEAQVATISVPITKAE